ncbi:MAG: pyridoxal 5'-phosphate synthase glutaminase subunit PdxT [Actinobacteria bacterium]|nr:pyridoxal 5'-phosphate synthase glutaminase subunit PdxT [Actinomycetota bacterium]
MRIGVLALQGDFREHMVALAEIGISVVAVKTAEEITAIDALVIPGGESTTISKLAKSFNLFDLISDRISNGMPTYGSCAGMILVAKSIQDPASGQDSFGGIDMVVKRNAFGRQVDSFEADLDFKGITEPKVRGVFIRAPWVESCGPNVEVLAKVEIEGNSHPVAVREGKVLATAFHPELTGDFRVHRYFVEEICKK